VEVNADVEIMRRKLLYNLNAQILAIKTSAVEAFDGSLGVIGVIHLHESEATRLL